MGDQIITAIVGMGIVGGAYLIDLIIGSVKVMFTPEMKWSWSKMLKDLLKALVLMIGVIAFVAELNVLVWYSGNVGADLSFLDGISFSTIVAAILGGAGWYMIGASKNIVAILNKKNVSVEIDESKANYAEIAEETRKAIEAITPDWIKNAPHADEHSGAEAVKGQGSYVSPLSRRLLDGDNDNGKGWQCSKYSYYLATGIKMSYAPHPDYGPVNGRDMVNYLVNNYGFVRCGKEAGAIFSYNSGKYGHTGMVLNPNTNTVNDANWSPLKVGTHYLDLDALRAIYCKPVEQIVPADESIPEAAPEAPNTNIIHEGDTVTAWGAGAGDSYGGGGQTAIFPAIKMKVISINNNRYALNQYNKGVIGDFSAVTGWWTRDQIK